MRPVDLRLLGRLERREDLERRLCPSDPPDAGLEASVVYLYQQEDGPRWMVLARRPGDRG